MQCEKEPRKRVNTKGGQGSLGTDLEATLGTGYHSKLRIFLFPHQRPDKEWCLSLIMRLATMKTFLNFRVRITCITSGVGGHNWDDLSGQDPNERNEIMEVGTV